MRRIFERNGLYWIDYKDANGVRHRKQIGPDKRIAREILDDILGKVARREYLGRIADSKISFSDFCGKWKERVGPSLAESTKTRWWGIVDEHLKPAFPGALRSITAEQVEDYQQRRLGAGVCQSTVNREITVLVHMFNAAVRWEYLATKPFRWTKKADKSGDVKKHKEPSGRTRFLSLEDITRLLNACTVGGFERKEGHHFSDLVKAYLRPLVVVALNTGMRRGELLALRRRDIDWTNRIATLEHTKNGDKRHVHLNDAAIMALRSLPPRLDTDRLFPFRKDQVGMAFRRAVQRAKLDDFRFHDLRHTYCSHQAMNGAQPRSLMALMGHKDPRMTTRYSHLSDAYLREANNRVVLGGERQEAMDHSENGTQVALAGSKR